MRPFRLVPGAPPPTRAAILSGVTEETERIRVMLVDDHEVVRRGLRGFLELQPDIEVVGEAPDGVIAVEQAASSRPTWC